MDPTNETTGTEAELESFRQRWREEVSARAKGKLSLPSATPSRTTGPSISKPQAPKGPAPDVASHSHTRQQSVEVTDEVTPYVHHDLGEKQHGRRLDETSAQAAVVASANQEPKTALDHYEKAVERETQGNLGDSVALYRKAFKVGKPCNMGLDADSQSAARRWCAREVQSQALSAFVLQEQAQASTTGA